MAGSTPPSQTHAWLSWRRLLSPAFIAVGVALVVWAVSLGLATFYLVLVFPVVTGSSALLLCGALLIVVGVFLLPWSLVDLGAHEYEPEPVEDRPVSASAPSGPSSGGLVLLGPVPIFFGSWKSAPGWAYWTAVFVGAALLLVFVLFVFGLL